MKVYSPPNIIPRIRAVWAFLSVDDSGNEGVCAMTIGGLGLVPLIAADEARLAQLRPLAVEVAKHTGKRVILARFESRVDQETIA